MIIMKNCLRVVKTLTDVLKTKQNKPVVEHKRVAFYAQGEIAEAVAVHDRCTSWAVITDHGSHDFCSEIQPSMWQDRSPCNAILMRLASPSRMASLGLAKVPLSLCATRWAISTSGLRIMPLVS